MKFYLVLHRIRSAYNVGSMFRTADALGVDKIFITGYTQSPGKKDYSQQTKAEKMLAKTALGADRFVPWEKQKRIGNLINKLKAKGIVVVALEQDKNSIDCRNLSQLKKQLRNKRGLALVVGNETRGIDPRVKKKCEAIVEIPMRGQKESLNVAVAWGIAGFLLGEVLRN